MITNPVVITVRLLRFQGGMRVLLGSTTTDAGKETKSTSGSTLDNSRELDDSCLSSGTSRSLLSMFGLGAAPFPVSSTRRATSGT
jgi:hypothetical protein